MAIGLHHLIIEGRLRNFGNPEYLNESKSILDILI
jgi:hypothetical protein